MLTMTLYENGKNTNIIGKWRVKKSYMRSCHEYFGLHHPILIKKSIFIANYISSQQP